MAATTGRCGVIDNFRLDGRVATVTGASRGLGLEIARALGSAGARIYINGTDEGRLGAAVDRLGRDGVVALPACFDVSDADAAKASVDRIFATEGRLDILVNNVGVRMRRPLEEIGATELRHMLDVDLVSAFSLSKFVAPMMADASYGRIINISSVAALRAKRNDAAYIIVKGAMNAMTRSLACEFGRSGITCNAIMPGPFLTESNPHMRTPEMQQMFSEKSPLGRAGEPWEIAGPAVFLASPAASFVTGVCLAVDGGTLAQI